VRTEGAFARRVVVSCVLICGGWGLVAYAAPGCEVPLPFPGCLAAWTRQSAEGLPASISGFEQSDRYQIAQSTPGPTPEPRVNP
jgi:hypothetical protein